MQIRKYPKLFSKYTDSELLELEANLKTLLDAKARLLPVFHVKWSDNTWFSNFLHTKGFLNDSIRNLEALILKIKESKKKEVTEHGKS